MLTETETKIEICYAIIAVCIKFLFGHTTEDLIKKKLNLFMIYYKLINQRIIICRNT